MDKIAFSQQEFPHKHVGALPRQRDIANRVEQIGYLSKPTLWKRKSFNRLHISLLIEGKGTYNDIKGRHIEVESPSIIIYKPEVDATFTPNAACRKWEEYYFIYEQHYVEKLLHGIDKDEPVGSFCISPYIQQMFEILYDTQKSLHLLGSVDRLDMLLEALFSECFLQINQCNNPHLEIILKIREYLDQNFLKEIDFEEIAFQYDMSMITLRRHWSKWIGNSPSRYVYNMKMQYAAHLIIQTDTPIGIIAQKIGFKDPLYFSRRFRSFTGMSATEYRNSYKETAP
jgi:AraC-like DNA-binding protein